MHDENITPFEHYLLLIRNIAVTIAAVLFLSSELPFPFFEEWHHTFCGAGYLFGAIAYVTELMEESDEQKEHDPHHRRKLFMPNVFGTLYVILAICHFIEGF